MVAVRTPHILGTGQGGIRSDVMLQNYSLLLGCMVDLIYIHTIVLGITSFLISTILTKVHKPFVGPEQLFIFKLQLYAYFISFRMCTKKKIKHTIVYYSHVIRTQTTNFILI